jgi:hypothetical protein
MRSILITCLISCFCLIINGQNIFLESAFKIDNAETGIDYIFTDFETDGLLYFSHKEPVPMFSDHTPESGSDVSVYNVGVDYALNSLTLDGDTSDVTVLSIGKNEKIEVSYILTTFGKSCRLFFEEEEMLDILLEDSINTALIQVHDIEGYSYSLISGPENVIYKITPYENGTLISGNFKDSLVYTSPDQKVSSFSNNSSYNGFLLSIDKDGEVQWVHLSPTIGFSLVRTVGITDDAIIFPHDVLFGTQFSLIDFDGNTLSSEYLQGVSIFHIEQYLGGVIGMSGNYYTSGGTADVDFGSETYEMPIAIEKDAFLNIYDKDLNLSWSQVISGKEIDTATNFDYDDTGGIYLTGCIQSDGIFDGGTETYIANGAEDVFISHYSWDGIYNWTNTFGGNGTDVGLSVVANNGDVVLSGIFRESMDVDPSDSLSLILEDTNDEYDPAFFYAVFNEEPGSAIKDIETNKIVMSPNPTSDYLTFNKILTEIEVYTSTGKMVLNIDYPTSEINIEKFDKGVYFVIAKDKNGDIFNDMVLKW